MKKILSITVMLLIVSLAFFACDSREFSTTPTTVDGFEPPVDQPEPEVPEGPVLAKDTSFAKKFKVKTIESATTSNDTGNNMFFQTGTELHTLGTVTLTFTKLSVKYDGKAEVDLLSLLTDNKLEIPKNPYGKDNTEGGNATMGFQGKFGIYSLVGEIQTGKDFEIDMEFKASRDIVDQIEWGLVDTNADAPDAYWFQLVETVVLTDDEDPAFQ